MRLQIGLHFEPQSHQGFVCPHISALIRFHHVKHVLSGRSSNQSLLTFYRYLLKTNSYFTKLQNFGQALHLFLDTSTIFGLKRRCSCSISVFCRALYLQIGKRVLRNTIESIVRNRSHSCKKSNSKHPL